MKKRFLFLILFCLISSLGFAREENEEVVLSHSADVMGTGGAGIAASERFGMIYQNPASLAIGDFGEFSVLRVGAMANTDLYDMYLLSQEIDSSSATYGLEDFTDDQWEMLLNVDSLVGITGPLSLGYVGQNIGLLLYSEFQTMASVEQSTGLPYVNFGSYLDLGFIVGYGMEIPLPIFLGKMSRFYAGISLKYINRIKVVDERMSLVEAFDTYSKIMDTSGGVLVGQNISADLGFNYQINERIAAAAVVRDFFNTGFYWTERNSSWEEVENSAIPMTYFYPALDIGVAFKSRVSTYRVSELNVYFDIVDCLDFSENYMLKLRLGADVTFLNFLVVRAGLYKGYPTLGLTLDLPVVKINAVYYTEELGDVPGTIPMETALLELEIKI